tara:strand:+ start:193 stop:864 length:672 start_codon:yes stop_codon:yes gene_type:complete
MQAVVLTGVVAGFVHVLGGADHLIAMAPAVINNPQKALKNSFSWGLGHSSGVLFLAFLGIFIKDIAPLNKFSNFAEFLVGISLLVVGVFAMKNFIQFSMHSHSHKHNNGIAHRHFHLHFREQKNNTKHSHALTGLGLLHGIAGGTHFLAVLPALALPLTSACFYLISYLIGSLISMILFSCLISFTTINASQKFIKRLIAGAGGLSFSLGLFWIQRSASIFLN